MHSLPSGRGMFIWRLTKCEGGDLDRILAKCARCGITWLAIKAGDQGRPWSQFNRRLVDACHAAGLTVYGWSYDVPGKIPAQLKVAASVKAYGADGYMVDAEVEWDQAADPDGAAARYASGLADLADDAFLIADAPWDVVAFHKAFPFTAFAPPLSFRSPQMYHLAHGLSLPVAWDRFIKSWRRYAAQRPAAARPLIPALSAWEGIRIKDVIAAERLAREASCPGVIYWAWDSIPVDLWAAFENGTVPRW